MNSMNNINNINDMNDMNSINDINNIRNKIDEIDCQILKLFEKRLSLMPEIADYKRSHQLPIHDEVREAKHIEELIQHTNKQNKALVKHLFTEIMNLSKKKQKEYFV